jgi:DNA-binding response OmpR family regulator
VVPRAALLAEAGRGDVTVGERTIDVHVSRLRKHLGDGPGPRIETIRGAGYMFTREGE